MDEDEDSDEDDTDVGSGDEEDATPSTESNIPKDIAGELKTSKLTFQSTKWDQDQPRSLDDGYRELKSSLKDGKSFPQFNRFCSVLDMRNTEAADDGANDDNKEDKDAGNKSNFEPPDLFVFEPEKTARTIHKNALSLNFFNNAKNVIPNPKANDDDPLPLLASGTLGPQIMVCASSVF